MLRAATTIERPAAIIVTAAQDPILIQLAGTPTSADLNTPIAPKRVRLARLLFAKAILDMAGISIATGMGWAANELDSTDGQEALRR